MATGRAITEPLACGVSFPWWPLSQTCHPSLMQQQSRMRFATNAQSVMAACQSLSGGAVYPISLEDWICIIWPFRFEIIFCRSDLIRDYSARNMGFTCYDCKIDGDHGSTDSLKCVSREPISDLLFVPRSGAWE